VGLLTSTPIREDFICTLQLQRSLEVRLRFETSSSGRLRTAAIKEPQTIVIFSDAIIRRLKDKNRRVTIGGAAFFLN